MRQTHVLRPHNSERVNDVRLRTWPARRCERDSLRRQMTDQPFTAPELAATTSASTSDEQRRRVPVRAVRGHARQAERQARAGHPPRRPDGGRRRLRRLRRRRHRPGAARPRPGRDAGRPLASRRCRGSRAWRASPATCTSRARSGPTARARSCAASSSARRSMGFEFKRRRRARVLPGAQARRRLDRAGRPARHARPALLRHARPDAQPRLRLAGRAQHHRARLGQLRHRPRGRQRPVRAELRVRRRADHLRPRDLLPLHGRVAGAGARADRDLHAQAVRAPDRQRLPLPHEPVEATARTSSRPTRPTTRAGWACRTTAYQFIGGPEGAREGVHRGDGADRHLLQAARGRARAAASSWAPVYVSYGYNNRTQMLRIPAAGPHRGPHRRRLVQPLPRRRP